MTANHMPAPWTIEIPAIRHYWWNPPVSCGMMNPTYVVEIGG